MITLGITAIEIALITFGGFILAFWYVRNRIIEKKQLGTSILKYFQGLFPVGVMFFGIYVILSFNRAIGSLLMVLATFFYIVSSVTYTVDRYDSVHRATILSLGYTRQEYAIRYLFKSSSGTWVIAALNFFVAQFIAFVFIQIIANYEINAFENDVLYVSIALMICGFLLSIFKSFDILEVNKKE